ncbi:hypothetical protein L484_011944 [Morus notabilis]|uniref:Uncharacterized protein n=2 Tax=Morus notabilis TaxID=981085 RepID=W9QQM7_9ROSA|nr:hypothetical protein L484_011944 [Morus notabilis]
MELLKSHGCQSTDDQDMNAAPSPPRTDGEIMSSLMRNDQRERIKCWWEYSKPKKKRGLHQGNKIISPQLFKDHDDHHFNGGLACTIENPSDQICPALLFPLVYHFCQAMVGVDEMSLLKKEAAANFIMCSSWGDNHGTRKEQHQHVHCLALSEIGLVRN